jgi:5-methyltetrahydropteroyltriglutamate--homocysteine methyltransferase
MRRSGERILTTHTGSLRKPAALHALLSRRQGEELSAGHRDTLERDVRDAVADVVHRQLAVGLDIVDDGDMSKTSFFDYIRTRLGGVATYCVGPLALEDPGAVRADIDNLRAALTGAHPTGVFVPAVSPGMVARTVRNEFSPDEATFVLQLDCPDLASGATRLASRWKRPTHATRTSGRSGKT